MKNHPSEELFYSQQQLASLLEFSVQTIIKYRKLGLINSTQFISRGRVFIDKQKFLNEDLPRLKKQLNNINL
ncbi:MAG: hypothetical protein C0459_11810 [Chitinophaga sp.]|jgi:hypothetical protein|nr:hypothetical protein [Chitinophaga sp.]